MKRGTKQVGHYESFKYWEGLISVSQLTGEMSVIVKAILARSLSTIQLLATALLVLLLLWLSNLWFYSTSLLKSRFVCLVFFCFLLLPIFTMKGKVYNIKVTNGFHWWSSGWDSVLPMEGSQIWFLFQEFLYAARHGQKFF